MNASLSDFLGNLAIDNLSTGNPGYMEAELRVKVKVHNTEPLIHIIHIHENRLRLQQSERRGFLCFSGKKEKISSQSYF